jgi:redox-regulated HSP33 family molecular chaperone
MSEPSAHVIRAITTDKQVRFAALDASPLWDGVRRGHPHLEADACAALVELISACLLLQSRNFFSERLQLLLKASGRAKAVVADGWPDGVIRGVLDVAGPERAGAWVKGPGLLQVMRSNPRGTPYIGTLEMVEGGIRNQIEAYLQQSEQVMASNTLWCNPLTGECGGLLVEPMPDCPPQRLALLVDALEGLEVVPFSERTPEFLTAWVNQGDGAIILSSQEVRYACRCSRESLLETLGGFEGDQRAELFGPEGDPLEMRCDYCGKLYVIRKEELRGERP